MNIGDRIAAARKSAGWSQARLADAINQAQTTVSSWERGRTEPTRDDVARIADALGLSRIDLEGVQQLGEGLQPVVRRVPVVGFVQAGAWVEQAVCVDPIEIDPDTIEWLPFDDPQYKRARLFCLDVRGPSANLFYPEGNKVICALPQEAGVREGDFVVAQRRHGALYETTLKQLKLDANGDVELWPRSSHPDFQEPIRVKRLLDAQEGVTIIGVVIARYEVARLGHGPLLNI